MKTWSEKANIRKLIAVSFTTLVGILILGLIIFRFQINITNSYMQRYESYIIADELRQSSDDLTKFVRMYAATADEYYKSIYFEVLDIRNGDLERPLGYEGIYWDLMLADKLSSNSSDEKESLIARMKSKGFTEEELSLLSEAQQSSDRLVELEKLAMRATENNLNDEEKLLLESGESQRDYAIRILNDDNYNQQKFEVMKPINTFYQMFDERTQEHVDATLKKQITIALLLLLLVLLLMASMIIIVIQLFMKFSENEKILENKIRERTQELLDKNIELQRTQKKLIESEKMASLGNLVAGVAHEINTPIGIAVTVASYVDDNTSEHIEKLSEGKLSKAALTKYFSDIKDSTGLILSSMQKADKLIRTFKKVAVDQSSDDFRELELDSYLEEILSSINSKIKKTKHKIMIEKHGDLRVKTYPGAIYQIITNLIFNSLIHGFEDIESGNIKIIIRGEREYVSIEYYDDGRGISSDNISKIFEPFFTTKRGQGGSGLGLNIVYNLVSQKLNGSIECTSIIDKGVCFKIIIPR